MRSKNMNLNITIKASSPSSNSEKKKNLKKKNDSASVSFKSKSKKENSDKTKIKNIIKKENFLNKKLSRSTSFSSYEKRKNIKLFGNFFNKKKITLKKSFPEKDSYSKIYPKKQVSNKSSILNEFSSKSKLNIKSPKNSEKKYSGNIFVTKLIKPSTKLVDTNDKKKKFSSNHQKNTQKKSKHISSDLNIILNKKNFKLGKEFTQSEKPLKKKKNKIIKNFIELKNLNIMEDKENQVDNSYSGSEKKEVDEQIELQEDKDISIKNDHETNMTEDKEANVETNKNISMEGDEEDKEEKEKLIQDISSKKYAINSRDSSIDKSENLEHYFSEGTYESSNDIFNGNYQKVTNTLLPGYTIAACEGIYQANKEDTTSGIQNSKIDGTYIYKSYFPPYEYIPHLNKNPVKKAYYLRKHEVLNNYLYTSADLTHGTIHEQSNMVVAYPYGVPVIDINKK
ncbi:conserved Plasmodium protein, unknown function [Plasmodium relictum]|uniref:Uncharacterized protein n=1 Tax=Plasmodium relictum TaxID=85471 RepID=A0A1J1H278_PLARL|nr:conserved Plasmodium protein, unknown function [Plasmodium relictum]CRG98781.1 conserved Plasmodium protein, unknown function [Plasmodium relictum]